ncbi:MAG: anthranilate phosphoribosyltransferase [Leptospiraceae bacterium]|nr:anthranilate phosphoribosyltransferase [Leptospiraceae bacterium]MCP5502825.1 anthranilate phosphoribosyltransferase [Leptospiraceae bacterium]
MNLQELLFKTIDSEPLSENETYYLLSEVMKGEVSEIFLSAWLTSMRMKEETRDELLGAVRAMLEYAQKPARKFSFEFIDTCGTGGDGKNSVNVSTLSAIILASMGIKVAKHGNRSVSSLCGSSDLLQALGFDINAVPEVIEQNLERNGFTFLFAPNWHPAMKHAVNVRKTLGFRTIFNLLGPLSNPFRPSYQVVGVFSRDVLSNVAYVLEKIGLKGGIVCHSEDGYDEFSLFAPTEYILFKNGQKIHNYFEPQELGQKYTNPDDVVCNTKEQSIELARMILRGEEHTASHKVALNAGVSLYLLDKVNSIKEGYKVALGHLLSGKPMQYFQSIINK